MSLADLLDIPVATVSRIPEHSMDVPAAVYVITQEDIHRSGATSIPEALRLAPGLQVARTDGGTWSVGIRGFADRLARSMLVLIDGRAVYSPLFAGTYWETQDVLLEDVDRIEVVRGPGGTLWGANAVNGIINIITRSSKDTQGVLVSAAVGSEQLGDAAVRYGGRAGGATFRLYAKGEDKGSEFHPDGNNFDGWRAGQAGGRADWASKGGRTVTLQGDVYDGRLGENPTVSFLTPPFSHTANLDAPLSGGNVLARVSDAATSRTPYQLQLYYDRTNRHELPVSESRDTFDVDFQQTSRRWSRQTIAWGAGYRASDGRIVAVAPSSFTPPGRTDNLYTAFLQDEFILVPDRWRVTVGSKIEHNDYTGVEVQPSARVSWTPTASTTMWAAATRAVRTPSRVETDYTTTSLVTANGTPTFVRLLPNPDFQAEKLVAYELGYRVRPAKTVYTTISLFYDDLHDTLSTELLTPFVEGAPARLILPVTFGNGLHGDSYGGEFTGEWRATSAWRLTGSYSYLSVSVTKNPGGNDVSQEKTYEGSIPHHQFQFASSLDLRGGWSLDGFLRYTSRLKASSIPGYATADVRLAWRASPRWEVAVVGQDLLHERVAEWPSSRNIQIQRSVYARLTWRR